MKIKIFTVIINIIIVLICFLLIIIGLLYMSPWTDFFHFSGDYHVNKNGFFIGITLNIISLIIPISANKILYHTLHKKYDMHKSWFNIPAIISTSLSLVFIIYSVLSTGIDKWIYAEWV